MWQVVDAPEILTVIGKIPHLSEFLNSLYDCQYKSFFSAFGKQALCPMFLSFIWCIPGYGYLLVYIYVHKCISIYSIK